MLKRKPGRPPHAWLPTASLRRLPAGTAVCIDRNGKTLRVRLVGVVDDELRVKTEAGKELVMAMSAVRRHRIVTGVYEPGDPVLHRGVPAAEWRGGVVRTRGREVYVELIDGSFEWLSEDDLERPEARPVDVVDDDEAEVELSVPEKSEALMRARSHARTRTQGVK